MSVATPPAWFRELSSALAISPQIVLEGNVHDRYFLPAGDGAPDVQAPTLIHAIWQALARRGYDALVVVDPIDGARCVPDTEAARSAASAIVGRPLSDVPSMVGGPNADPLDSLRTDLVAVALAEPPERVPGEPAAPALRVALVVELASRLTLNPTSLSEVERRLFVGAEQAALSAQHVPGGSRAAPVTDAPGLGLEKAPTRPAGRVYNSIIYVVDRDRDLPDWLVAHDDRVRTIAIPRPDFGEREALAARLLRSHPGWVDGSEERRSRAVTRLAGQTDGMTLRALYSITQLAQESGAAIDDIDDAARAYRVGVTDNPWKTASLRERLAKAEERLSTKVIGQDDAIRRALDILLRATTGLSGAQSSPNGTGPRGKLFFAGPTGVGKTEFAKQLAELVFGDERACIRFDMSEFSSGHAADRLIGAPPGYLGFAAGGELTNAVRERPFSLLLFDEIEKADPQILDKFLQILEDGRLTDGRGATVYFTECVIVFTSNLGIWVEDPDNAKARVARVFPSTPPEQADKLIREGIEDHFTRVLGRPELLNRLGDGIVVFNFIEQSTAVRILDLMLGNVAARVEREYGAALRLSGSARATLVDLATQNLANGGRGIGTVVESALVNPLARALFSRQPARGDIVEIGAIRQTGARFDLELTA